MVVEVRHLLPTRGSDPTGPLQIHSSLQERQRYSIRRLLVQRSSSAPLLDHRTRRSASAWTCLDRWGASGASDFRDRPCGSRRTSAQSRPSGPPPRVLALVRGKHMCVRRKPGLPLSHIGRTRSCGGAPSPPHRGENLGDAYLEVAEGTMKSATTK
jgi:hypothetical protein